MDIIYYFSLVGYIAGGFLCKIQTILESLYMLNLLLYIYSDQLPVNLVANTTFF